jgi:hypothetical protein
VVFRLQPTTAATRAAAAPPTGGVYRRAAPGPTRAPEEPFARDPNQLDRALQAHADVQNGLCDFLGRHGAAPWSPGPGEPDFDLAWIRRGTAFVAEVKSLTETNEDRQLRLGLGQVLDYQALMADRYAGVRAVLAVERPPGDARWLRLCERHRALLVWPDTFPVLLDDALL